MPSWILSKIILFLSSKEGCTVEAFGQNDTIIVKDAFGYRYEVTVRCIGKLQPGENVAENEATVSKVF